MGASTVYSCTFQLKTVHRGTFYVWAEEALALMRWEILDQDECEITAAGDAGSSLKIRINQYEVVLSSRSATEAHQKAIRF
jgi:hypothetical protein